MMFRLTTRLTAALTALVLCGLSGAVPAAPEVGAPAPAFTGVDTAGKT